MASPSVSSEQSGTLRCARHPGTETVLRCGRCDTPICPRCLVPTPVGARCPTCAQVKRFATLLKPVDFARAIGFGIAASAAGTALLTLVPLLGILGPLGYAAVGFGVGEAVAAGAHRKRSRELGPIAVACLLLGIEVGLVGLLAANGVPFSVGLLLLPLGALRGGALIGVLIGALLAWMRVR